MVEKYPLAPSVLTNPAIGLPPLVTAFCGMCVVFFLIGLIKRSPGGDLSTKEGREMERISRAIQAGARTFLRYEYTALFTMVAALFILISAAVHWQTGICYLAGAITSASCGYLGMWISTVSNVKTAEAARTGLNKALRVAFNSGSVMGLTVVSAGLGVISILLMAFGDEAITGIGALAGFGMGASTVAIFARVAGGIFTKAADVGADLVGKVEKNLPEDDARNPATIADNVGDNVGDVAGMGADLFSSFVGSIIASSLLGAGPYGARGIALPYWISMTGIVASVFGMATVRCREGASQGELLSVLRRAQGVAGLMQVGFIATCTYVLDVPWELFGCIVIGLAAGLSIGTISEIFTSSAYPPVLGIAKSARIGPANVVIAGLAVGMYQTIAPTLIVCGTIIATYTLAGSVYGIALASTGLLSTLGITLATDAYGPVADNAGGIAEMAGLPEHVRQNTDVLDALGNTTAAVGKGFAVGSAVLTALSLLSTFVTKSGLGTVDATRDKFFLAGALLGAMLPYWFGALTMGAVNRAAQAVVIEVRRQFQEIKGLIDGTAEADYERCVAMITSGALHAMVFPVFLVVLSPIIIGVGLGPSMLAGMILGAIVSGFMLGGMMSAAGGAWDNAKKFIESPKGKEYGGKGRAPHKAAVVGDTIGDPFKDTSGPALNILIKLMSYISVVLAPVFKNQADYWWASLIVIGFLLFFVPWWNYMTPESMTEKKIEEVSHQLLATVDSVNSPKSGGEDNKNGSSSPIHRAQAAAQATFVDHQPLTPAANITLAVDAPRSPLPSIEMSPSPAASTVPAVTIGVRDQL